MRIVPHPLRRRRTMLVRRVVISAFYGLGLLGTGMRANADFPAAKLRGVRPVAEIKKGQRGWIIARNRAALVFGDHVRTGPRGAAQIIYGTYTNITLRENTEVEIKEPETADQPLSVRLLGVVGEILIRSHGRTEVRTAAATAASKRTEYSVRLDAGNQTTVTVSEGQIVFFNPQGSQDVAANEQSTARVGTAPTVPVRVDASGLLAWTGNVAGLPVPFELPRANRDSQALQNAKTLLQEGNARGAEAAFRALLGDPQSDEAQAGVALALLSNNDRAGAVAAVANATTPLAAGVRAQFLLEDGDAQGAQTLLAPLVAAPDAPFQLHTLFALTLIQNGDVAGAGREAARAVELAPASAGAHATLALAQFFAHTNDNTALQNARRALDIDPFSPLALLAVGRLEATHGNLDDARQALEQATSFSPGLPGAQRDLGTIELALDRLPQAERALRASLAVQPDDARTLAALGTVLLRRGDRAGAQTNLDRAVGLAPNDPYVRANRAAFLVENGDLEAAAREGDFLLARQTTPPVVGTANVPLLTDDPALGALFIRLSESALFRQQLNEALRYAREAVRLLPDSAPAQYQLGRVFLEQGRITQAQNRFQLASILNPNDARARYALGFTQELVAQGGDIARPLGQIQAAREGAPNVALSLQNQATPGSTERYQAAIQDPTAIRASSRSFGDWQLDGRLGTQSSATGEVSYLHESDDRRGLTAFGLRRDTTQGVRRGADNDESVAAITLGRKAENSPSALFAYLSYQRLHPITDIDFDQPPVAFQVQRDRPDLILGANIAQGQNIRTRLLFQAERNSLDSIQTTSVLAGDFHSVHLEARNDLRFNDKWSLATGLSVGQRRYDVSIINDFSTPTSPLKFLNDDNTVAHNSVGYGRLIYQPSSRLRLEGELKARSFQVHNVSSFSQEPATGPPFSSDSSRRKGELLPSFVATYRAGRSTLLRYRARRLLGAIEDFELLSPTDLFGFDESQDVPNLSGGSRGRSFELEASHTFSNASFLRIGLFRVEQNLSASQAETLRNSRVQGLRLGYEGLINRTTAFFTSLSWNGSRGTALNPLTGGTFAPSTFSDLPDYAAEIGLQYLSDTGFFVQPSMGFIGPRFRNRFNDNDARQRLEGFPLFNLRVGKRFGLRRSFYVEVSNLFDQSYTLAATMFERQQPGRQLRVGATLRF